MTISKRLQRHSDSFFSEQILNPTDEESKYNDELIELDFAFIAWKKCRKNKRAIFLAKSKNKTVASNP